jgi:aminopeptidase N
MREPARPVPPLSFEEPAAAAARRRPLPVRPRHVRLDVRLDPARPIVEGRVDHTIEALHTQVRRVTLDAADLTVTGAWQDGAPVDFAQHPEGVDLDLARPMTEGETATLSLTFRGHPSVGLFFVGPTADAPEQRPQIWTQGAMEDHHHWFPCFDAPQHLVTTEVIATVPEEFVALANGEPVPPGPDDEPAPPGTRRFHYHLRQPHALYLLTLVVDRVVTVEDRAGDVLLQHHVPAGRTSDAAVLFERMPQMLSFFAEATGRPYPFGRYGHVFLQGFMWGGMENTTLTSLTDQVLVEGRHRGEEDVERLFAHELAHQWFGDLIAPRGWPEIWLNESFATYFEVLCMGALDGADDGLRRLVTLRDNYLLEARSRYARPVVTRTYAHPYVLFDKHAYEKGALVLHTLRDQLGDALFFKGVRRYVATLAGQAAETAQLRRCLEVRLTRTDTTRVTLDVTVAVGGPGGLVTRRRMPLAPGERTYVLDVEGAPRWVAVDPDSACLLEVDESAESDAALRVRLDPTVTSAALRARTCRLLGDRPSSANRLALIETLQADPSETTRLEAARALGEHRHTEARTALFDALDREPAWRVRAAAARAVGVGADESLLATLEPRLNDEPSHRVRCGFLRALGDIPCESARALLRRDLDTASPRACVAAAAVTGLAAHEDAGVLDELMQRTSPRAPRAVRTAALAGIARIAAANRSDGALVRRVRARLEAHLTDSTFAVRAAAIDALKELGDPAARTALERAHAGEAFALLRRLMREALGALGAADNRKS